MFILAESALQVFVIGLAYDVVRIFFLLKPEGAYSVITDALEF